MPRFNISEIIGVTEGKILGAKYINEFCGISIDSRTIRKGELFIALRGNNFDGHDFIKEVLLKGASGAVVSKDFNPDALEDFILIVVKDTLVALKDIASFHRSKFDIPLIGVTGSNGKTTTKEMIHEVLSSRYRVLKTSLNNNNQIGVSLAMLNLDSSFDVSIAELGINHYGEMEVLRKICRPSVAVFTNIGCSHLEFFDTPRNVLKAKMGLIDCFGDKDTAVINADDNLLKEEFIEKKRGIKTVSFGIKENADFKARVVALDNDGTYFEINGVRFFIPVLGLQNIYNA
ncbi:MAG: UDP-N-acetylmuramoyl-tripeptide--D-alanyl-D-alanine ligase, partial [Candidatus Omnitrophica bacterium]|nr:UDP-N-acetylmuramoyl-tripeptide--D-alanyl-D-alanine ligase [Candidatus Omnitrophota bacterium]